MKYKLNNRRFVEASGTNGTCSFNLSFVLVRKTQVIVCRFSLTLRNGGV